MSDPVDPLKFYDEDADRIVAICAQAGLVVSKNYAMHLWAEHSEAYAAGWLGLGPDDEYVLNTIKSEMEIERLTVEATPFYKDLQAQVERLTTERDRLKAALERSQLALDDWLHTYAPEHCHEDDVARSKSRIKAYGTIGYIASVSAQNKQALGETP